MKVFMFSPDDGNFCQFMNQNVPNPMFLGLNSVGALKFYFFKKHMSPVGPIQGPDGAPMQGPPRAHGGRRPTKWRSGGGAPRKSIYFFLACATAGKV